MSTDFIHDRSVRRIMKSEGDAALAILLETLSYIYSGEGYFVRADALFYADLASEMYSTSVEEVERILRLAVSYELFDAGMFETRGILTSAEIQRQYLFVTKRRSVTGIAEEHLLIAPEELPAPQARKKKPAPEEETPEGEGGRPENATQTPENVTQTRENVTQKAENVTSGTQSIAQHSIAQHSTENLPPVIPPPCPEGGKGEGRRLRENSSWPRLPAEPPADGVKRNFKGLMDNLKRYGIPPDEQHALIRESNYGEIGHPLWKALYTLHHAGGKIKLPGRFLLSRIREG